MTTAVAVLALVCAAGATAARLTAPQYRARATAVCEVARHTLKGAPPMPKATPGESFAQVWKVLEPELVLAIAADARETAQLERLAPPLSLAGLVRQGLAAKHGEIATMQRILAMGRAHTLTFPKLLGLMFLVPDGTTAWKRIGAPACA